MSLMAEMGQRAMDLGVPLSVHIDITYRCNERCVHCYLDHDDHGEMTTAEIKKLLGELAEAGVFLLTLSGGEIMVTVGPSGSAVVQSIILASPKSSTLTSPEPVTMTFDGLRSRWMIPAECAAQRASTIWTA